MAKNQDKECKQSIQPQRSLPQGKCVIVQTNKESVPPEPENDEKSKPVPPKAIDGKSNCKENGKKWDQNAKPSIKQTSVKSKKGGQSKHKLDIGVPTESDEEFRSRPLPIPGDEDDDFYDDLVKNIQTDDEKIIFVCKMCSTTCTHKADVKRHWKQSCEANPNPEITCLHCLVKEEKVMLRGESNLVVQVQNVHSLKGDYICLKCHLLLTQQTLRDKHISVCKIK